MQPLAGERLYLRGGENKRVHCVAKRKAATAQKGLRKQVNVRSRLVALPSRPPYLMAGEGAKQGLRFLRSALTCRD